MKYLKSFENNTLDSILDKISELGIENLSEVEKDFLSKYSNDEDLEDVERQLNSKSYTDTIGPYEATIKLFDIINNGELARWNAELYINDIRYIGWIEFDSDVYHTLNFINEESDIFTDFEGLEYEIDDFCQNAFYENYQLRESLLLENKRIDIIGEKYNKIIDKDIVEYFLVNDPTRNKVYFQWLCDRYSKLDSKKDGIETTMIKMVTKYNNIKTKIKEKQINRIKTIDELSTILNQDNDWNELEFNDDVVLYEDLEWIIFEPKTKEISGKFGDKAWCTVYDVDSHYYEHFGDQGALIYCINKLDRSENFAIEQTNKGKGDVWDSKDVKIIEDLELDKIAKELLRQNYIRESEMVENWTTINIQKATMTETIYRRVIVEKMKDIGIKEVSELFGAESIFSFYDEDLYDEIDKLLIKTIKDNEKDYINSDFDEYVYDNQILLESRDILNKLTYIFGVDVMLEDFTEEISDFLEEHINWEELSKTISTHLTTTEIREALNF